MIKLMHFADYHLGMENFGRFNSATGLNTRVEDYLHVLDWMVEQAIDRDCDLVLFAGDAFKTREPNQTLVREFAARMKQLVDKGIQLVLLAGNHDAHSSTKKATTVSIYDTLQIKGVFVANEPQIINLEIKGERLQILALPWIYKSKLLEGTNTSSLSESERSKKRSSAYQKIYEKLYKKLDSGVPSIALIHATISGATFGAERSVLIGNDLVLSKSLLEETPFSYVALGHIHHHQRLSEYPPIIYSGGLERIDFSEEHDPKGCMYVEIKGSKTEAIFLESPARPFKTINIEVDEPQEVLSQIEKEEIDPRAIMRLIIRGPKEVVDKISERPIRTALKHVHYLCPIVYEYTKQPKKHARPTISMETAPLDALKQYGKEKNIPRERLQKMVKKMQEILQA